MSQGKRKDLVGMVFGRLVVSHRVFHHTLGKGAVWSCRCECGNRVELTTSHLAYRACCGCKVAPDISGQSFGRLTAIGRCGARRLSTIWECLCECGQTTTVPLGLLEGGHKRSCGCLRVDARKQNGKSRLVDLLGAESGRLTVIARTGRSVPHGSGVEPVWLCRCECGATKELRGSMIRYRRIISCGCVGSGKRGVPLLAEHIRQTASALSHKRRAQKLSAGGSFTAKQVENLYQVQRGRCAEPTCRVKLNRLFHRDHRRPLSQAGSSNDIRNIQILCAPCNSRKAAKDEIVWARENGRLL